VPADSTSTGTVLALAGEFDLAHSKRLKDAFERVLGQTTVVLDMTRAAYVDSTFLGSLIRLRTNLSGRSGSLIVVGLSGMVRRVFDVTSLSRLFDIRPSLAEVEHVGDLRRVGDSRRRRSRLSPGRCTQ